MAKANRILKREHLGHSQHPLTTTQEKTLYVDVTRWSTPITLLIFFAAKDGEALYSQEKQELELTATQTMNNLIKKFQTSVEKYGKSLDHLSMT